MDVVHKISAYAVTQHPAWMDHVLGYVSDLADAATYREAAIHHIHRGDAEMLRFVADFRAAPLVGRTTASVGFASVLTAAIEVSLARNPVLAGAIEDLLIAEVFHRCKWEEVERDHPETLEWLRRGASQS